MKSLVLGGSAFIGRRLVEVLHAAGHSVTVLNRGLRNDGIDGVDGVARLVADRRDPASVRAALGSTEFDAVFDVSGQVQVSSVEAIGDLVGHLEGRCGVYVFVSSIAAYALGSGAFPWTEDRPLSTSRPTAYGGHKAAVERLLAEALLVAATVPDAIGGAFNITADAVSALHYVHTIAGIVGIEPDIRFLPEGVAAGLRGALPFNHRFQKVMHSVLGNERARQELGITPRFDFAAGHRHTYEWFRAEGLDRLDGSLRDPVWGVSWDFAREAELAATLAAP